LWAKGLNAEDIHKENVPVYSGVCRVNRIPLGGKRSADDEDVETEVRLGQQSKYFYVTGFNALVKRWDRCINLGGGYVDKYIFFPGSYMTYFKFYIHF
jgi:hypothetical protein